MKTLQPILFSIFLIQAPNLHAVNHTTTENNHSYKLPATPSIPKTTWLGISTGPVPSALRHQLHRLIPANQGVLVTAISPSSPAEKAGLQKNDVLLSYNDQKLYSPMQLSGLVRSEKPEQNISLQIVQQGQLKMLQIPLGTRNTPVPSQRYTHPYPPFGLHEPRQPNFNGQALAWDSFESVQVNTLPDGRYHAEVRYKGRDNDMKSFIFEGKRKEIIEQISKEPDLPLNKKNALLRALNLRQENFFQDPFFQQGPFNHPFFQNNPFNRPFPPQFNQPNNGYLNQGSPFNDPLFWNYFQRSFPTPPQIPRYKESRI